MNYKEKGGLMALYVEVYCFDCGHVFCGPIGTYLPTCVACGSLWTARTCKGSLDLIPVGEEI